MTKILAPLFEVVAWMVLLLSIMGMALSFYLPYEVPFNLAAFLKTVGVVSLLAFFAEVFRRPIWGKWGFAALFGLVAYRLLEWEYTHVFNPHSAEAAIGFAVIGAVFGFGAAHLHALPRRK